MLKYGPLEGSLERRVEHSSMRWEFELEGASPNGEGLLGVNQSSILLGVTGAASGKTPNANFT